MLGFTLVLMGVVGLRQRNMAQVHFHPEGEAPTPVAEKAVTPVNVDYLERVRRAMEVDKLYLNPTLTLTELAQHIGLNSKVVSQLINTGMNQSFNDYVNAYRVDEVKRRLRTNDLPRFTLLGIAFESGFNSKTTFNRIFKEHTGQSPITFMAAST